jgi:hypothetical protein
MKLLPILLGVSLAANAALVVVQLGRSPARAAAEVRAESGGAEAGAVSDAAPRTTATGEAKALAVALNRGEPEALRDELRAAGVDEEFIRMIVGARAWKRREVRMRELHLEGRSDEWWKQEDWSSPRHRAQREEIKALQAEVKAEVERLLGPDPDPVRSNPWLARQYGYLPAAKREAVMKITQDYQELQMDLNNEANGFRVPGDREKQRFLEEEKRRDLAAILSPEELEAFELRNSNTAGQLRWQMTKMNATEEEYRKIFAIRSAFDEANALDPFTSRQMTPQDWERRNAAEKGMREQIRSAIGEERYKEYVRSQNHEYQQLQGAVVRFGLAADAPARVFDLRDHVSAEGTRIADDKELGPEQKGEALKRLAAEGRQRLESLLGPEVAAAFKANTGSRWLDELEKGMVYTFDENGGTNGRSVEIRPRAAPQAK